MPRAETFPSEQWQPCSVVPPRRPPAFPAVLALDREPHRCASGTWCSVSCTSPAEGKPEGSRVPCPGRSAPGTAGAALPCSLLAGGSGRAPAPRKKHIQGSQRNYNKRNYVTGIERQSRTVREESLSKARTVEKEKWTCCRVLCCSRKAAELSAAESPA